jgi:hypothetical protein
MPPNVPAIPTLFFAGMTMKNVQPAALPSMASNMADEPANSQTPDAAFRTGLLDQLGIMRPNFSPEQNALRESMQGLKRTWQAGGFVKQEGADGRTWSPAPPTYPGGRP